VNKRRQGNRHNNATAAALNQRIAELDRLVHSQQMGAAADAAEQLFQSAPLEPGVLERSIAVLRQAEAWPRLTALLLDARNRYQLWPQGANLLMGQGLVEQAQHREAVVFLEAALNEPDDAGWAHHFLGKALRQGGELEEALEHQRQAAALMSDFAWAPFDAAELLLKLGRAHEAVLETQEARRRLAPNRNPVVEQLWAELQPVVLEQEIDSLIGRGQHGKALALLRRALAESPNDSSSSTLKERVVELVLPSEGHQGASLNAIERELLSIELLLNVLEGKA